MKTSSDVEEFGDVLKHINEYSDRAWLYLPSTSKWGLSAPALVLVPDEVPADSDDDGIPTLAQQNDMFGALTIADVQDIVSNARSQRPEATLKELFVAFIHYYDNDAFLDFAAR